MELVLVCELVLQHTYYTQLDKWLYTDAFHAEQSLGPMFIISMTHSRQSSGCILWVGPGIVNQSGCVRLIRSKRSRARAHGAAHSTETGICNELGSLHVQ